MDKNIKKVKATRRNHYSLVVNIIMLVTMFVVIGILMAKYVRQSHVTRITKDFIYNETQDSQPYSNSYDTFWSLYNRKLSIAYPSPISMQEKAEFDQKLFVNNGYTVDEVTKTVKDKNGKYVEPRTLIASLMAMK